MNEKKQKSPSTNQQKKQQHRRHNDKNTGYINKTTGDWLYFTKNGSLLPNRWAKWN